jgi:hypothetical protein
MDPEECAEGGGIGRRISMFSISSIPRISIESESDLDRQAVPVYQALKVPSDVMLSSLQPPESRSVCIPSGFNSGPRRGSVFQEMLQGSFSEDSR